MEVVNVLVIPEAEWQKLLEGQQALLNLVKELSVPASVNATLPSYLSVKEFMKAVRIGRTKFDQLVASNHVKVIRKGRKIYIPSTEVQRYFGSR
jgi:excisionase family DNA binding protein